eukprot:339694-Chlamydomonas_euryale.AAC.1
MEGSAAPPHCCCHVAWPCHLRLRLGLPAPGQHPLQLLISVPPLLSWMSCLHVGLNEAPHALVLTMKSAPALPLNENEIPR